MTVIIDSTARKQSPVIAQLTLAELDALVRKMQRRVAALHRAPKAKRRAEALRKQEFDR